MQTRAPVSQPPVSSARVLGYARVSRREQSENTHALQQQIQRLRDAGCDQVLWDVESGTHDGRKEFRRVLEKVREGEITEVVITRLDRITRSPRTNLELCDLFANSLVTLRALDDSIDTRTPTGRFVFRMMGSLAGMEVERLSERVRHGQAYRRRQGRVIRSGLPLGIRANEEDLPELDDQPFVCHLATRTVWTPAQVVQLLATWTVQGSCRLAAAAHREFWGLPMGLAYERDGIERRGVRGAIRQPLSIGQASLSKQLQGPWWRGRTPWSEAPTHEAILGPELAAAVDRRIAENRLTKRGGSRGEILPVTGLAWCASCGGRAHQFTRKLRIGGVDDPSGELVTLLRCGAAKRHRGACGNHRQVAVEDVQAAVVAALRARADALARMAGEEALEAPEEPPQAAPLREALAAAEEQYRLTGLGAYEQVIADLGRQLAAVLASAPAAAERGADLAQRLASQQAWEGLSAGDLRVLFAELVERVEIGPDRQQPVARVVLRL